MEDFLIDDIKDLQTANGDIAIGHSDEQHKELLLVSFKGDFKERPTIGVGLAGWLKDDNVTGLLGEIKSEFERDGMEVNYVEVNDDKINIDASY
jgi:hypothetical protein